MVDKIRYTRFACWTHTQSMQYVLVFHDNHGYTMRFSATYLARSGVRRCGKRSRYVRTCFTCTAISSAKHHVHVGRLRAKHTATSPIWQLECNRHTDVKYAQIACCLAALSMLSHRDWTESQLEMLESFSTFFNPRQAITRKVYVHTSNFPCIVTMPSKTSY